MSKPARYRILLGEGGGIVASGNQKGKYLVPNHTGLNQQPRQKKGACDAFRPLPK